MRNRAPPQRKERLKCRVNTLYIYTYYLFNNERNKNFKSGPFSVSPLEAQYFRGLKSYDCEYGKQSKQ